MSKFEQRISELEDLKQSLDFGRDLKFAEDRQLLIKLLEKHMESLEVMYRGRIQDLLQAAIRAYTNPGAREELLRGYYFKDDERRYIDDVIKALGTIQKPDYLPSEF